MGLAEAAKNNIPSTGWLEQQTFVSHSSGGWESRIRAPARSGAWGRPSLRSAAPSHGRERTLVSSFFFFFFGLLIRKEDTNPIMGSSTLMVSSKLSYLAEGDPPPNTNTQGIRASTYEFRGDVNTQSTAGANVVLNYSSTPFQHSRSELMFYRASVKFP